VRHTTFGWQYVRVGDLVARGALLIGDGYRVTNAELASTGTPFVRGGDIGDGDICTDVADHIAEEFSDRLTSKLTMPGDSAFIAKGTVGRVGHLRARQPQVVFSPQVCWWRVLDHRVLVPGFVYYLLRGHEFQANLNAVKTHGAMAADYVSMTDQYEFRLPIPPIGAQRAIAHVLGSLDDKIDLNRRMNETLEEMARAIFKSWFVDFDPVRAKMEGRQPVGMDADTAALFPDEFEDSELGEIPKGWRLRPLDEVADFLNGLACQKYPPEDGDSLPVIKIRELRQGFTENSDRATTAVDEEYIIEDGDLLFSWSGSLEVVMWCRGRGVLNQHLFKVTSPDYPKWFYHQWLLHHLPEFRHIASGKATTMGHIKRGHLTEALVVVPPADVIAAADAVMAPLLGLTIANELECRTLAETRDTLLPKLMSGELRVPE